MGALLGVLRDLESAASESTRVQAERSRRRADRQHHTNGYEHNGPAAEEGRSGSGSGRGDGRDGDGAGGGAQRGPSSPERHDKASLRTLAAAFLLNGTFEEQMVQAFSATIERIDELLRDEHSIGGGSSRGIGGNGNGSGGGGGGGGGGDCDGGESELSMRDLVRACFAKEPLIYNGTNHHENQVIHPQGGHGHGEPAEDEAAFAQGECALWGDKFTARPLKVVSGEWGSQQGYCFLLSACYFQFLPLLCVLSLYVYELTSHPPHHPKRSPLRLLNDTPMKRPRCRCSLGR